MKHFSPRLSAMLPDQWSTKESITLLSPDGQANVIASSEPLSPGIDGKQYAEMQGELFKKEFPGYQVRTFAPAKVFGGRDGYFRQFDWTTTDTGQVTQVQLYYVEAGIAYTATATSPSARFPEVEVQLLKILDSLSLE